MTSAESWAGSPAGAPGGPGFGTSVADAELTGRLLRDISAAAPVTGRPEDRSPAGPEHELRETLKLVADTIVESLGFGVAVVNLLDETDGALVAVAIAGPDEVCRLLAGRRLPQAGWQQLLAASQPWGELRFLDHATARTEPAAVFQWLPDLPESEDPEAWHPEDALFAPLTTPDGQLVGLLSVDVPPGARRPDAPTRRGLEAFAVTACLAISHALLLAQSRQAEQHLRAVFDSSPVAIALLDRRKVLVAINDAFCAFLGRPREQLLGADPLTFLHPADRAAAAKLAGQVRQSGRTAIAESRYLRPDGSQVWGRLRLVAFTGTDGSSELLGQIEDITERKQAELRLLRDARHDPLTRLPNRAEVYARLSAALGRASGLLTVVLFCDLDRVKQVNDAHGHAVGDEYLRAIGQRLRSSVRAEDTVGRIGGDEFVIVLEAVHSPTEAIGLAGHVLSCVQQPLRLAGTTFTPSMSMGIAYSAAGDIGPEDLIARADTAMYRMKAAGRGGWRVYDPQLRGAAAPRELRDEVRGALAAGQFVLHHQPIVRLADRVTIGHEALLRWAHPDLGLLVPSQFLDVIVDSEWETPVTDWVLHQACREAAAYPADRLRVSVNLSSQQLRRRDLPAVVATALACSGLAACRLQLELTDSRVVARVDGSTQLARLREMGVSIAVDDVGAGRGDLAGLQGVTIDAVKLHRSLVVQAACGGVGREICRAVIELAARCGWDLVAKGVETEEQAAVLTELGAPHAQGYLFGRPAPR